MVLELCTDSVEGALLAKKYGIKRIELCTALDLGGLTPSIGLIKKCAEISHIETHVLIRNRDGGFDYNQKEIQIMKSDIMYAKDVGAHGVVFGILNTNNEISNQNQELVTLAKKLKLEVTFHRAIDLAPNYERSIIKIIKLGFDRILTSGNSSSVTTGLDKLRDIQQKFGHSIQIMAGGGVKKSNIESIKKMGIKHIHFSARKKVLKKTSDFSFGNQYIVDKNKVKELTGFFSHKKGGFNLG